MALQSQNACSISVNVRYYLLPPKQGSYVKRVSALTLTFVPDSGSPRAIASS